MEMYFWLFGTAILFTGLGYYFRKSAERELVVSVVESTIDKLIEDGYLKTRGVGEDMVIIKPNDKAD
jgi:hypothetical protein